MAVVEPDVAPRPSKYLGEPEYDGDQDEETGLLLALSGFVAPTAPRTFPQALDWLAHESANPTRNWHLLCQMCMRMSDGAPGGAASAKSCFLTMPKEFRVVGGDPDKAPIGADLFSASTNPDSPTAIFGHVLKKARPFKNGGPAGWSTDALRSGHVDKVDYNELYARWGHEYLGWGYLINGVVIDVKDPPPVRKPYNDLGDAVLNMEAALDEMRHARAKARELNERADVESIQFVIDRGLDLKSRVRNKFENLRHK